MQSRFRFVSFAEDYCLSVDKVLFSNYYCLEDRYSQRISGTVRAGEGTAETWVPEALHWQDLSWLWINRRKPRTWTVYTFHDLTLHESDVCPCSETMMTELRLVIDFISFLSRCQGRFRRSSHELRVDNSESESSRHISAISSDLGAIHLRFE